ncbi:MAG: hypothetical protein IPL49_22115 [Saprospirales bacterium]|nr:hypothetical protein [Saprospirales bacterium]
MKPQSITSSLPDTQSVKNELPGLQFDMVLKTDFVQHQEEMLIKQIGQLCQKQANWSQRLMLSQGEREQLEVFWKRQQEALDSALQTRNQSLQAIREAHLSFIREVCNSLLLTGRSSLQVSVGIQFTEHSLQLRRSLEKLNESFWDLMEEKLRQADNREERIRSLILEQITHELNRWNEQYDTILDTFAYAERKV